MRIENVPNGLATSLPKTIHLVWSTLCLIEIARAQDPERRAFIATTSSLNFRMSFDVCIKYYDEVVDSIPSLPLNSKIMTTRDTGHPEEYDKMFPEDSGTLCKYSYSGNMVLWPTLST